jgi:RNA polymerase sigma-70 factor (ECF subfamily)
MGDRDRSKSMASDVRQEMVALLPRLRRFALVRTGSREAADELVQTACERALARLDQFTPGTRLDSWMFRIIETLWIDTKRYAARRPEAGAKVIELMPFDARIHEQAEARADLAIVRAEVARLPEEQRSVLALVAIDGQTYQQAAETLGVPIGTIMSRLSRARRRLVDALEAPARRSEAREGPKL